MFIRVEVLERLITLKTSNIRKVKRTESGCQIFFMRKTDIPMKTDTSFDQIECDLNGFIRFNSLQGGRFLIRKSLIRKIVESDIGCVMTVSHPKEGQRKTIDRFETIYSQLMPKQDI